MSTIALAQLGQIAELQAGVGFPVQLQGRSSGDYPVAKVGDISRVGRSGKAVISTADHYVDEDDLARLKARPIPLGSVLFAKIGEAIRQNHRVIAGCTLLVDNNAMAAIPNRRVESRYLYHFLRTVDFYKLASTTTVPALRKSQLKRLPVPLPPLTEQRRIAGILDAADVLRAKRREALAQLDTLIRSTFLEMFGDPVTNPMGWEITPIDRIGRIQGGLQVTSKRRSLPIERPYLRVANVFRGFLELDELKTIRLTRAEEGRTSLESGDILIVEGHGNKEEIGRCARWDGSVEQCVHQNHLIRLRCDRSRVSPIYVEHYINSPGGRRSLTGTSRTTSGLNTISVSKVAGSEIQLPPLDLQHGFAAIAESVERQKASQRAYLAELDTLLASLQSRAFRGEL